ncbi:MAG: hypothetical protein EPGJADBJ_05369 [Saprospiraceae bacterium]|nr:hypothetical protein [Saprospiraceae bacterium]
MAGLGLASASAMFRLWALSQTSYANGWDAYFYLVQLKSLEETGSMHSPEASLFYPYLRLFYWITGEYVPALKTGTAILAGAFTATVFWMAGHRASNRYALPFTVWSLFSPHLTYFAAQYPKNLFGLVLLVAFIGSLDRLTLSRSSVFGRAGILPVLLLVFNYFGHRLTFALAVIYLTFWMIARHKQVFSLKKLLHAAIAICLFLTIGRIFPGLFHIVDFGRLSGVLSWAPQFAPYSFVRYFGPERISGWWMAEVAAVTGCWLLVVGCWLLVVGCRLPVAGCRLVHRPRLLNPQSPIPNPQSPIRNPQSSNALPALCSLLLFPFLEWTFTGVAWRFFLVFVLLTPLLVIDFQFDKRMRSGLIFAAVLLCCSFFSWKSYDPELHDPGYARFEAITDRSRQVLEEKNAVLVIAPNALSEFFTFTTGTDAMPWLPEYAVDSSRLWRIATNVQMQTLRYYAGEADADLITALGYRYFLLPEHVWQRAIWQAKAENDKDFLAGALGWPNPSQIRPAWLLQRKRTH